MPAVAEHEALVVIGAHDHGPPPKGMFSVAIRTEQSPDPGGRSLDAVHSAYDAVLDIHEERAKETGARWIPGWSEFEAVDLAALDRPREVNLFWYGTMTPRRGEIVGKVAKQIHIEGPTSFLGGEDKRRALLDSKIVLIVHAYDCPGPEPFRYAEAAACGALIVSEHSKDSTPWVAGEHLVEADPDHLGEACRAILEKWDQAKPMRLRALDLAVRKHRALHAAEVINTLLQERPCPV